MLSPQKGVSDEGVDVLSGEDSRAEPVSQQLTVLDLREQRGRDVVDQGREALWRHIRFAQSQ